MIRDKKTNNMEKERNHILTNSETNYYHLSLHRGLLTTYKVYWKTCYAPTFQNL